jgi:hypothetical protein
MLFALSIAGSIGLFSGVLAAGLAHRIPRYRVTLQEWGGGLVVASAALLGLAFPMI